MPEPIVEILQLINSFDVVVKSAGIGANALKNSTHFIGALTIHCLRLYHNNCKTCNGVYISGWVTNKVAAMTLAALQRLRKKILPETKYLLYLKFLGEALLNFKNSGAGVEVNNK